MNNLLLITCQKCGYMIYGRPWRCPGCGGAGSRPEEEKGRTVRRGLRGRIAAVVTRFRNET